MAGTKTAAVLLAGGHGSRMQSKIPKQFLLLNGHTVLWHALQALSESEIEEIVLVTPQGEAEALYRTYREEYGFRKLVAAVEGAVTRLSRDSLRFGNAGQSWFLFTMPRARLYRRNF